jgi:SAM-dependent methyltransferase
MSLWSEFLNHQGRTIHKWRHYFPAYETHFARYVNRPVIFLEIGCGAGGSLQLWKRYLGPLAQIIGIDINENCREYEEDQIAVRIGDQKDTKFLSALIEEFGTPDVILDDGSHVMADVTASFNYLYPRAAPTGVYVVEDLHTAYWDEFGGGAGRQGSFVELCKSLVDQLNAYHTRDQVPVGDFTKSTLSMHFYDSMVVFERGQHIKTHSLKSGMTFKKFWKNALPKL